MKKKFVLAFAAFLLCAGTASAKKISARTRQKVLEIGTVYEVPESVTGALMYEESRCDDHALGPVTAEGFRAHGLFQLYDKPENMRYLMWKYWDGRNRRFDVYNPLDNAEVALHYLADLHKVYKTWYRALCFYNCGFIDGAPKETQRYAMRIISAP